MPWIEADAASDIDDQFLASLGAACHKEAVRLGSSLVTVDIHFLVFLRRFSQFGFFQFGPVCIDVGIIEAAVERSVQRTAPDELVTLGDDVVRFSRLLMGEVQRSGRRRIDELHYLLAFINWNEGLPRRVFGELGVTAEQVERFARDRSASPAGPERLYSPEEAAEYLGVHVQTVRAWIRSGRLRASRLAGQRALRIRASDLTSVLEPVQPGDL